jgi:hypothetical protein
MELANIALPFQQVRDDPVYIALQPGEARDAHEQWSNSELRMRSRKPVPLRSIKLGPVTSFMGFKSSSRENDKP